MGASVTTIRIRISNYLWGCFPGLSYLLSRISRSLHQSQLALDSTWTSTATFLFQNSHLLSLLRSYHLVRVNTIFYNRLWGCNDFSTQSLNFDHSGQNAFMKLWDTKGPNLGCYLDSILSCQDLVPELQWQRESECVKEIADTPMLSLPESLTSCVVSSPVPFNRFWVCVQIS